MSTPEPTPRTAAQVLRDSLGLGGAGVEKARAFNNYTLGIAERAIRELADAGYVLVEQAAADAGLPIDTSQLRHGLAHGTHTPCCGWPDEHMWADPIRCMKDHEDWPCFAARAALAAPPASEDLDLHGYRPLDVERLALALNATVGTVGWMRSTPADPVEEWLVNAAAIAAAYESEK